MKGAGSDLYLGYSRRVVVVHGIFLSRRRAGRRPDATRMLRTLEPTLSVFVSPSPNALPIAIDADPRTGAASSSVRDEVLALYDACAPAVRRYVRSCGVAPDIADDVVHETFLALFHHLRRGGGRENLRGWLMQVGYRLALKQRRGTGRLRRWQGPWQAEADRVFDPAPGPEDSWVAREDQRRLRAVMTALPERDRQCVHLRAEGLRYREIARVLGISLGAVAKSLTRALDRLAVAIDR